MSLVNQMLKDLERHRQKGGGAESIVSQLESVSEQAIRKKIHPAWMLLVAVIVVAVVGFLYWPHAKTVPVPEKKHITLRQPMDKTLPPAVIKTDRKSVV